MRKYQRGMTIAELLVVVSILVMLMLLSYLAFKSQIFKGYDTRRKADLYQIKVAVEEYEKDHHCYPQIVSCQGDFRDDLSPYIPYLPCDPVTKKDYAYYPDTSSTCPKWYWIFSYLDNQSDVDIEKLGCENGCGPTADTALYDYYEESLNAMAPAVGASGGTPPPPSGMSPYYGCFSGECLQLSYNQDGTLECSPSISSPTCYGLCINPNTGLPQNECE